MPIQMSESAGNTLTNSTTGEQLEASKSYVEDARDATGTCAAHRIRKEASKEATARK